MIHPNTQQTPSLSDQVPLVSIVLPTYNHRSFLPKAIQSIFAQTFKNFELIIVNDGSTDGTCEYLSGIKDDRIRIIHQENQRLPNALNNGFKIARGELFTWISSDNYYSPIFLDALVSALNAYPIAGFAYSAFAWINAKDEITRIIRNQDLTYHALLAWNPGIASFMYRRTCHEQSGYYNPALEGAEDWDMWLRITEKFQTVYVPEILCYYRQHLQSMSGSITHRIQTSSQKAFTEAIKRNQYQFNMDALYPSISLCTDQNKARFHACLDFGTTLLTSPFAPLELSCRFLEEALSHIPNSILAATNLAVAYARNRQWDKAMGLVTQLRDVNNTKAKIMCDEIREAFNRRNPEPLKETPLFRLDKEYSELFTLETKNIYSFTDDMPNASEQSSSDSHDGISKVDPHAVMKPFDLFDDKVSDEESRSTPGEIDKKILQSEQLFHEGRYIEAEGLLQTLLKAHPYHPQVLNTLACILWETGRKQEAIQSFIQAVEIAPDDRDIIWNVGQIFFEIGSVEEAVEIYKHYLEQYPEDQEIATVVEASRHRDSRPGIRYSAPSKPQPQIFYFCYDHQKPSGGQRQMYRHVDILNQHGYQSFALHMQSDYRLTWFDNQTAVISLDKFQKIYRSEHDIMVLPEDLGDRILSFPGKKVIFNQGVYLGFYSLGLKKVRAYPYLDSDIKAVIVVSEHNREYLEFAYPGVKIYRTFNGVEDKKFTYQPVQQKKKQIACLPAKNPLDLAQVFHILSSRSVQGLNQTGDYQWSFIENLSETDVIRTLQDSLIFIFLSTEEGFPLMPLEAMLSGCLVVGYKAGPLLECLNNGNSFLCPKGDALAVARTIEDITTSLQSNAADLQTVSLAALNKAGEYSPKREEESIITAWEGIVGDIS
ncbi:MAG: glycosyltransferase [Deltaproteobacteria bacterium]|nr:glycosyltransferase [Deltaproteobacteria bacterium]